MKILTPSRLVDVALAAVLWLGFKFAAVAAIALTAVAVAGARTRHLWGTSAKRRARSMGGEEQTEPRSAQRSKSTPRPTSRPGVRTAAHGA